ncbi:glutamine synthetase family protein [Smaragdicoccus niigatensis]|uniref:glutamine synthetase family protein n=1 Tax=Smaragdicoccus niigatensis TaxID=359359 RepID=UPI0003646E03|nr:glutamine synthetase family protein [Smaragdicoccus niigatensis]
MADGMLTIDHLSTAVDRGEIDTVVVAMTDMQGRLQGKRCDARYFLSEVATQGTEACNYLLAVDVEMTTVDGYAMSSWERGYGDFLLRPDFATLRRIPWQPGTALILCDLEWLDGSPVVASPRQILRAQIDRLAAHGLTAFAGTELEFIAFEDTYEAARHAGYRGLTATNQYNVDYSILGTSRIEPLLRKIRTSMAGSGMTVESAKGECNDGQHEIAFRYKDALTTCDNHSIFKTGAKEIAAQQGQSLTFMAKFNEREGNSCHIHMSMRRGAESAFAGFTDTMRAFLAGQLACARDFTLMYAPNINSYKRFAKGSFAPTAVAWGVDNRTCAFRVVGHGDALRVENRIPGGDVNPYLSVATMIAAGLHGIENGLTLEEETLGNAYQADKTHVPSTLREAAQLFGASAAARAAFGEDVVNHYLNMARVEVEAFDATVTDWERMRGFERL